MMPARGKVLLVDDDPDLLRLMCMRVQAAGFTPIAANNAREALAAIDAHAPVSVVTDLRMEGMDGLGLYEAIHRDNPLLPVIIMTAHGTIPDAVDATRRGVFAFLTKPFEGRELIEHIERAIALHGPTDDTEPVAEWRREFVTRNPRMLALLDHVGRLAETEVAVHLHGPSGAGKERLARTLHRASRRHAAPFVTVDCAVNPDSVLEATLFGHTRDAFRGAEVDRLGAFRAADGGTLLLDAVAELSPAMQAKLTVALTEQRVQPLGAADSAKIDVRVLSAAAVDLERAVADGGFRRDLFHLLTVARVDVPSLEARREDIPGLVQQRLQTLRSQNEGQAEAFTPAAMELLIAAPWPGNVRQLLGVVDHCAALASGRLIPADLAARALALREKAPAIESLEEARARFDQEYLVRLMKMTAGNVARAAQISGRNRTDLYKLLRRHGIDPTAFKND